MDMPKSCQGGQNMVEKCNLDRQTDSTAQSAKQCIIDDLIKDIDNRVTEKILEPTNAELLKKLIKQADSLSEAINIAELGTTYKLTGFHFDKRLEKLSDTIKYFKKNTDLSFTTDKNAVTHKLIIGDNYQALLNLLIEYKMEWYQNFYKIKLF